jgi:glycosyltransferase 2 family protein
MNHALLLRRMLQGILFGFVVLLVLLLLGDLRAMGDRFLAFHWPLLPAILGLTLFNYILRFFKWHYYLKQMGISNLSAWESARIFVAGFPLAVTPGKAGEVIKAIWLQQKTDLPTARGVSVVLSERISDGMAVLMLSVVGVIAYPQYWPAFAIVFFLLATIMVVSQIRPLALYLLRLGERMPVINRFAHGLSEFYEGSYVLFRPKSTLVGVGTGMISWLGEGLGFYLVLIGFGVAASWTALSTAVFVLSFSIVLGAVSALPGGLGMAEASIAGMLALLLGLGADTAAAATLLIRFATLWFGVGLGLVVWVFWRSLWVANPQNVGAELP